ncbi:CAP-associated domain-containing protein [Romboutsia sedimentorum]|uniref:CAP-associated domain-containing protein n=1 Tax=Romboutsia sedimentorum TaxID=1368474 RepID=A0ABT7ED43_9FIRM|nr:CAP-associated domain-containing protein [Romboutsia sedimentorum]MDK2563395.1 CAP-associated domain-containing protein [Romboutsia sedimentorum]
MKKIVFISIILISILFNFSFLKGGISKYEISTQNKTANKKAEKDENIDANVEKFETIKIGDTKEFVLSIIGEPNRIDDSEYDFKWYVYNQHKEKFVMVGIENDTVVGLYSNYINSCEIDKVCINDTNQNVINNYDILKYKKKGNTRYIINSKNQYDIVKKDNKYITFFYDIYESNRVCSYQIISNDAELSLRSMYSKPSENLKKSFELQVIDLTNSVRYQKKLNGLGYSEKATVSSRKHSENMMENNYFDHTDKENKSPFDRMKKEGIDYVSAGENIAAGQTSAIYAHEAWMNSKGHRNNILGEYNNIGVGVCFGGDYSIYYTQNFYK